MRVYAAALMLLGVACSLPLAEPAGANAADRSVAGDTSAFKGVQGMGNGDYSPRCFWHVEEAFRRVEVKATSVGYTGGHRRSPRTGKSVQARPATRRPSRWCTSRRR